jgi:hypothetical protein
MNSLATYLYQEELYDIPAGIIVVVSKNWEKYSTEEKELLTKILGSVKIDPASVQILARPALSLQSLKSFNPSVVLIFGSEIEEIKPYEAVQAQGFSVIKADDLAILDDTRKKNLWLALKQMFGI